jgi:PEP-CTERM motif
VARSGKRRLLRIGAFGLLALATASPLGGMASATTLIVNCSTVSGPAELASAAIVCPQFDIAATLTEISIAVSGGIGGSITLSNPSSTPQTGSGSTTTGFRFGALSGFSFLDPVFEATFGSGLRTLSATETQTISGLVGSGSGSLGNNTTSFGAYIGAGFFDILVDTSTLFSSAGTGGQFSSSQATSANATAVVTYNYVPEPATISLLALAFLGFGFARRGKSKPRL